MDPAYTRQVEPNAAELTQLLRDLTTGDPVAADRLIPLIYQELHRIAERQMRRERPDHTLQPTVLVHEAFLKMAGADVAWENRTHFFAAAATAMRRILVDHARRVRAQKRGGRGERIELNESLLSSEERTTTVDIEALDVALARLGQLDERQARIVELRFFAGLDVVETAKVVGVSPATVKRDWQFARVWLRREIAAYQP